MICRNLHSTSVADLEMRTGLSFHHPEPQMLGTLEISLIRWVWLSDSHASRQARPSAVVDLRRKVHGQVSFWILLDLWVFLEPAPAPHRPPQPPTDSPHIRYRLTSFLLGRNVQRWLVFKNQWTFISSAYFPSFEVLIRTEFWEQQKQY